MTAHTHDIDMDFIQMEEHHYKIKELQKLLKSSNVDNSFGAVINKCSDLLEEALRNKEHGVAFDYLSFMYRIGTTSRTELSNDAKFAYADDLDHLKKMAAEQKDHKAFIKYTEVQYLALPVAEKQRRIECAASIRPAKQAALDQQDYHAILEYSEWEYFRLPAGSLGQAKCAIFLSWAKESALLHQKEIFNNPELTNGQKDIQQEENAVFISKLQARGQELDIHTKAAAARKFAKEKSAILLYSPFHDESGNRLSPTNLQVPKPPQPTYGPREPTLP